MMMLRLAVFAAVIAGAACSAEWQDAFKVLDMTEGTRNASLCAFTVHMEGTVLLANNKCCNGTLLGDGETCEGDINGNLTYADAHSIVAMDCQWRLPSAVFVVRSTSDVVKVVKMLTYFNMPFTVRSGGHSQSCSSTCNRCTVISLAVMKAIEQFDSNSARFMTAEPGVTIQDAYASYANSSHMVLHGMSPPIGLGGHYLGGGVGYFTRSHGFGTDLVVGLEVVLATGKVVRVFEPEYEEELRGYTTSTFNNQHRGLLWGIKGSGHIGLGIVTKFWIRMVPKPQYVVSGYVAYNLTSPAVMRNYFTAICSYFPEAAADTPETIRLNVRPRVLPVQDVAEKMPLTVRFDYYYVPENSNDKDLAYSEAIVVINKFLSHIKEEPLVKVVNSDVMENLLGGLMKPSVISPDGTCASKNVYKEDVCSNAAWLDDVAQRMYDMVQIPNWAPLGEFPYFAVEMWGGRAATNDVRHEKTSLCGRDTWAIVDYCRWRTDPSQPRERIIKSVDDFNKDVLEPVSRIYYANYVDWMVSNIYQVFPDPVVYSRIRRLKREYDPSNIIGKDNTLPSLN